MSEQVWRVAQAIYEADPIMDCGEAIDGFQVTHGGPWPWKTVIEMDQEGLYLKLATAAIAAMPEPTEEDAPRRRVTTSDAERGEGAPDAY